MVSTVRPADAAPLDVERIRRDFPILATEIGGRPIAYLDNAATSQKPQSVIDALTDFYASANSNVHRSVHTLAGRATERYERARERVARFVGAGDDHCVVWTRGTTEAVNLIAHAWGNANVGRDDTVLLTEMEHHSNLVPWQLLAQRTGARLAFVPITDEGRLDVARAHELIAARPRVFSFTAKSNVLGTSNPVRELCTAAREHGVTTFVDGAQLLPHGRADVVGLGCDFLAFSSHKMLGPMGIGALVGRRETLDAMDPFMGGGDMIRRVKPESSSYAKAPLRFEAGTPSAADAVAFAAALDYLEDVGPAAIHAHETRLTRLALDLLAGLGVPTFGPDDAAERAGIVSFDTPGIHPHDVSTMLDRRGVAVRAGHHCCQPLMRRLGVVATSRASFYLYNTEDEVHRLADGLAEAIEFFRGARASAGGTA